MVLGRKGGQGQQGQQSLEEGDKKLREEKPCF